MRNVGDGRYRCRCGFFSTAKDVVFKVLVVIVVWFGLSLCFKLVSWLISARLSCCTLLDVGTISLMLD